MRSFQPLPSGTTRMVKSRIEDALSFLVENSSERDFTRLYDALHEMRRVEPVLYQSLRSNHLLRVIFDVVDLEDQFRCGKTTEQRTRS